LPLEEDHRPGFEQLDGYWTIHSHDLHGELPQISIPAAGESHQVLEYAVH